MVNVLSSQKAESAKETHYYDPCRIQNIWKLHLRSIISSELFCDVGVVMQGEFFRCRLFLSTKNNTGAIFCCLMAPHTEKKCHHPAIAGPGQQIYTNAYKWYFNFSENWGYCDLVANGLFTG